MCQECRDYATHIVNLEILGDTDWSDYGPFADIRAFADYLQDDVTGERLTEFGMVSEGIATSLARRFLSDVDWYELAEMYATDNPEIIEPEIDDCPYCDGSGDIPEENEDGTETGEIVVCPRCDGTGEIEIPWSPKK